MLDPVPSPGTAVDMQLSRRNTAITPSKLWCPVLPENVIEREKLISRRKNSIGHWCIVGSAGYGKTTLAALYCHRVAQHYGWLCLDTDDNDTERFSLYLAAAFISACPDRTQFREMVQSQENIQLNQIITAILNEALFTTHPILLVLDDYQVIDNSEIHQGISKLLHYASAHFKIIITSRTRPPLSLSALQMQGKMHFTNTEELAFNHEQSLAYLQRFHPQLTLEKIAPLIRTIDGWPTALNCLALYLATTDSSTEIITEPILTSNIIDDFFWKNILNNLPGTLKDFLMQTSVLNIFDAYLCAEVTGNMNSAALLDDILKRQLFITPADSERKWFRYHYLFQAFLTKQLQEHQTQNFYALHRHASECWLNRHNVASALQHALAIGDVNCVISALLHPEQALISQGNGALLEQAILMLPDDCIYEHYRIVLLACTYWLNRNQEKLLRIIDIATNAIKMVNDATPRHHVLALLNLYRAQVAVIRDEIQHVIYWANIALKDLLESDLTSRSQAYVLMAEGHTRLGDIQQAIFNWQKGEQLALLANKPSMAAWARHQLAMIDIGLGIFASAQAHQDEAIIYCETHCFAGDRTLWCLLRARAETAWEYFDLETVATCCEKTLQVCQHWPQSGEIPVQIIRARSQLIRGHLTTAYNHLQTAIELSQSAPSSSYVKSFLMLTAAELHLRTDNKPALTSLIKSYSLPEDYRNDIDQRRGRTLAICYFGIGEIAQSLAILQTMNTEAERYQLTTEAWRNELWIAACELALERPDNAITILNKSLIFAAERGLIGSMLVSAPYLESMLDEKLGITDLDSRHWRRVHDLYRHTRAHTHGNQQPPSAISTLGITPKEWRVFSLILTSSGNDEIALTLNLSLGTVKNTLTRIYRKLNVNDREAAIRIAQQLLHPK